jgi:hypothetical protein
LAGWLARLAPKMPPRAEQQGLGVSHGTTLEPRHHRQARSRARRGGGGAEVDGGGKGKAEVDWVARVGALWLRPAQGIWSPHHTAWAGARPSRGLRWRSVPILLRLLRQLLARHGALFGRFLLSPVATNRAARALSLFPRVLGSGFLIWVENFRNFRNFGSLSDHRNETCNGQIFSCGFIQHAQNRAKKTKFYFRSAHHINKACKP